MDYIEVFRNLKTNNKWGLKAPHKAVLMLTVIELYEQNVLSDNEICYDEVLKSTFLNVWNKVLPAEPMFYPEAYLPFWYLQNDSFWHIVPVRGKEDILSLMRDNSTKPSEAILSDSVKYAELDEDLYFLMTLPSGRSSLKRALLEAHTTLSDKQIESLAESKNNTIDYSVIALSDYERILSKEKSESKETPTENGDEPSSHYQRLNEDVQLTLNIEYFTFLKKHCDVRDMFKELCPTVFDLLDRIVEHPIKQGDIAPSFAFIYDNFLSDLKVSLLSEEGAMELVDKIGEAIEILRGNNHKDNKEKENIEIEHVYLDDHDKVVESMADILPKQYNATENRMDKTWTVDEESLIKRYYQQGKDLITIASLVGRTEVAIKSCLTKLGLNENTCGEENASSIVAHNGEKNLSTESVFAIRNSFDSAVILNKDGERVFVTDGKLKYLHDKLYRLNLKRECFTLKRMDFDGYIWIKGKKRIVAYPHSELYKKFLYSTDYIEEVEDIVDSPAFEDCKLKVGGIWYNYNGYLMTDSATKSDTINRPSLDMDLTGIKKSPLYAERRQALLRAMGYFRIPANIRNIARTISRTAWGAVIKEDEVEAIIMTIPEIEYVDGKYILRKK